MQKNSKLYIGFVPLSRQPDGKTAVCECSIARWKIGVWRHDICRDRWQYSRSHYALHCHCHAVEW